MRISKAFTGAEVQDLNVFGSESGSVDVVKTKMPMEEKVEVGDRVRRRAVFAKSDEEMLGGDESDEEEVMHYQEEGDSEEDEENEDGEEEESEEDEEESEEENENGKEENEEEEEEMNENEEGEEEETIKQDNDDEMLMEEESEENETPTAQQPDVTHESDLRWKENLFYRGEEELTRRRVFSNNLMQLVYGEGDLQDEETDMVVPEEEVSDDEFFHPKQTSPMELNEAAKKNRLMDTLDSEKLDIYPAVKHDWNDESYVTKFKNHFVTGVWGDQLSSESEEEESGEDDDAIVDLENQEEEENSEVSEENEEMEEEGVQDEILSEEGSDHSQVQYNSIEEEREANAQKKAASRAMKEAKELEDAEISSEDEKGPKKKEKKEKEEDYFDLMKRKRAEQEEKARKEFEDVPQAEKDLLVGLPTGTYCRILLENVPPAFIRLARPETPIIVGGLLESEEAIGMVRVGYLTHIMILRFG